MRLNRTIIHVLTFLLILTAGTAYGQYKDFVRKDTKAKLFAVSYDKKNIYIKKFSETDSITVNADRQNINTSGAEVIITEDVFFTTGALSYQGTQIIYDDISDAEVTQSEDLTIITFYQGTLSPAQVKRMREGNRFSFSDPISIEKGEFVRGLAFSVKGAITVSGEVNKDIISLFGNVTLLIGAVARGDVFTITGDVIMEQHASLYGDIYSGKKEYDPKRFRFYRESEFEPNLTLNYNRVDGLLVGAICSYVDADSALPSAEISLGYALESERARYSFKLAHTIIRSLSTKLGAEYYQKLASQDDWIIGNSENSVFVILATEDFKDYYETEGFAAWLKFEPAKHLKIKTGYRLDDTHWLRAHRLMWSLFGGSKVFRENFSSVNEPYRSAAIAEIDLTKNASLFLTAEFETRDLETNLSAPGWQFRGELVWSNEDIGSDFDYRRYSLTAIRYQPVTSRTSFRLRGKFANSDGYLPMYDRYFLGGFGTLAGYKHKEFIGTRYWMTNSEFWLKIPLKIEPNIILTWDVAQIADDAKLDDSAEVRHDIGLALKLAGIRVDVTKRLDSYS
ncbi:MAG TPA: BamA/TamA family outer membrane protein, partial [candidate division Zixibacteria bacterium]|nr:BamA/TamA family outer membrane protein [candidate division Zixibacteria bacterium]